MEVCVLELESVWITNAFALVATLAMTVPSIPTLPAPFNALAMVLAMRPLGSAFVIMDTLDLIVEE
jgi:hypothetical protein